MPESCQRRLRLGFPFRLKPFFSAQALSHSLSPNEKGKNKCYATDLVHNWMRLGDSQSLESAWHDIIWEDGYDSHLIS